MKKKKIAIVYDCPYPFYHGGGEKRLYEVAKRLAASNWEVHWYALKFWPGEKHIIHDNIHYHAIGKQKPLYKSSGKRSMFEALYFSMCIFKKLDWYKFDIIHIGQWPYLPIFIIKFLSLLSPKSKISVDWWEVWGKSWRKQVKKIGFIGQFIERVAPKITNGIISISEKGHEQLIGIGANSEKMRLIHNGIDYKFINSIEASSRDMYDIAYLGRLKNHKNVDHILHATKFIKDSGLLIRVLIIGDGPEYDNLRELANELDINDNIDFLGQIKSDEKAFSLLKSAKIFIHPSVKEGGGSITLLEANACGLPVIAYATDYGIANDLINEGNNGVWVEKVDSRALSIKIKEVLENKPLLEHMKKNSVIFSKKFDWDELIKQYDSYFYKLVNT